MARHVHMLGLALAACAPHGPAAPLAPLAQTRMGAAERFGPGIVSVHPNAIRFALSRPANVILLRLSAWGGMEAVHPMHSGDRTRFAAGTHMITVPVFPTSIGTTPSRVAPAAEPPLPDNDQWCKARYNQALETSVRDSMGRVGRAPGSNPAAGAQYARCLAAARGPSRFERAIAAPASTGRRPDSVARSEGYWLLIVSDAPTGAGELRRYLAPMDVADTEMESALELLPEALVGGRATSWAAYYIPLR